MGYYFAQCRSMMRKMSFSAVPKSVFSPAAYIECPRMTLYLRYYTYGATYYI